MTAYLLSDDVEAGWNASSSNALRGRERENRVSEKRRRLHESGKPRHRPKVFAQGELTQLTIRRALEELVAQGQVRFMGERRWRRYSLADKDQSA